MDRTSGPGPTDLGDIEAYIPTLDAEERRQLAETALDLAIIRYRAAIPRDPSQATAAKARTPAARQERDDIKESPWPPT